MKTYVGTWSCHLFQSSNLLADAFVLSAPVKSHFIPAALAAAVALSNAALAGSIAKSGIDIPIIRITVIRVAIVLVFIFCTFLFLHFFKGLRDKSLSLIHISEPPRRTPISYAVFCLKK